MYTQIPSRGHKPWIGDKCQDCQYRCDKCEEMYNRVPETHMKCVAICWCCANACNGRCQYMMTGKPIEGSTYTQRTLKDGTVNTNVRTCPKFERG